MRLAIGLLAVVLSAGASAQDDKPWNAMDYGPCLSTTVEGWSEDNVALKGRVVFLGDDAGVVFDTELLRVAAVWTGGSLQLRGTPFDGSHGPIPKVSGKAVASTTQRPGVSSDGDFTDRRPIPHGPMAREVGRFRGHWFHGDRVVLGWHCGGREVLESYEALEAEGSVVGVARILEIAPGAAFQFVVREDGGAKNLLPGPTRSVRLDSADGSIDTKLRTAAADVSMEIRDGGRIVVSVPASQETIHLEVLAWHSSATEAKFDDREIPALEPLTKGGPRRYPETLTTKGELGGAGEAFAVDTITVPSSNPWKSRLRFAAFDFVDEDTAALSTWNGDVWLVDGVDADLDQLTWSRFCTGLHDPLGLKVVDGQIYTHGRDGLYRLHDLNGDGWCDQVEVFNNEVYITKGFHEFAFDLQTDAAGNFYFSKGGPVNPGGRGFQKIVPHHGTVMRVSPDGQKFDVVMAGLRAPNGIGIGPNGEISTGDNQGTWMPACRLNISTNGTFGGCVDTAHMLVPPTRYDQPICWFPMSVDNSGGGQVWVPEGVWGPYAGEMLHQSYGQCALYAVLRQESWDGRTQGGVVQIPAQFASSQMRGRFHGDGHLYTTGFKGWQTRAARETAFQRVRRTQAPLRMPTGLAVFSEGIELTFSDPVDAEVAADPESYEVQVWNYKWAERYGSPEYRPSSPEDVVKDGQENRDDLMVTKAEVGEDGRKVFLHVEGMQTCMQMRITWNLDGADGELVEGSIHNTIHFLPSRGDDAK